MSDYKEEVMNLIAKNIKLVSESNAHLKSTLFHSMLDWYKASNSDYLQNLPVHDQDMVPQSSCFSDLIPQFDIIIGSDLIYFEDSIEPLVSMLENLFNRNQTLTFYLCMEERGK